MLSLAYLRLHLRLPLLLQVVLLIKLPPRFCSLLHIHCINLCLCDINLLGQLSHSDVLPEICHGSITLVDLLIDDRDRIPGRFDVRSEFADPGFVLSDALFAFLELATPLFSNVP